jgi:hypothetical protein
MRSLALLLALSVLASCHDDRRSQTISERQQRRKGWSGEAQALTDEAERLVTLRQLLRWDELTSEEPSRLAPLLGPMPTRVTRDQLIALRLLENSPVPDIERRGLRHLRVELQALLLLQPQVDLIDRYAEISRSPMELPHLSAPVDLRTLRAVIAATPQRAQRQAIQRAAAPTLLQLDDLMRQRQRRTAAARAEFEPTLFSILETRGERHTPTLLARAGDAVHATADLYRKVSRRWITATAGDPAQLVYTDLLQVRAGGEHQGLLPAGERESALRDLLRFLGLSLERGAEKIRTSAGGTSTCVSVHPFDLRLVRSRHGGLAETVELFEAAGRCVCALHVPTSLPWELRTLGPAIGPRVLGHVLGLVWLESAWLELRPRLSHEVVVDLVQLRILHELLRLRIDGRVMPAIRALIADAPPDVRRAWGSPTRDPAALFGELMQRELGARLGREEALGYLYELDLEEQWGDGGLDLRALALAHLVLERLHEAHGARWFTQHDAGRRLISGLCQPGPAATVEELSQIFGRDSLDYTAPARTLDAAWRSVQSK